MVPSNKCTNALIFGSSALFDLNWSHISCIWPIGFFQRKRFSILPSFSFSKLRVLNKSFCSFSFIFFREKYLDVDFDCWNNCQVAVDSDWGLYHLKMKMLKRAFFCASLNACLINTWRVSHANKKHLLNILRLRLHGMKWNEKTLSAAAAIVRWNIFCSYRRTYTHIQRERNREGEKYISFELNSFHLNFINSIRPRRFLIY